MTQRLVGHDRAKIRTANPDADHIEDPLAGVPGPGTTANTPGEIRHAIEHRMDLGHHIAAVHLDRRTGRRPKRHVQHGAILGGVDPVAAEHRLDALAHATGLRQLQQQHQGLVVHTLLGVVQVQTGGLRMHASTAGRVGSEQLTQVARAVLTGMPMQGLPLRPGSQGALRQCVVGWVGSGILHWGTHGRGVSRRLQARRSCRRCA